MQALQADVPAEGSPRHAPVDTHGREATAVPLLRAYVRARRRRQAARVHAHARAPVPLHARQLHEGVLEEGELQAAPEGAHGRARVRVRQVPQVVRDELPPEAAPRDL